MQDNQNNQLPPQNVPQPYANGVQQTQNIVEPPINPQSPISPQPPVNPEPQPSKSKNSLIAAISLGAIAIIAITVAVVIVVLNANNQQEAPKQGNSSYSTDIDNSSSNQDYDYYNYQNDQENNNSKKVLTKCSSAQDCIENLDNGEGITVEQYNAAIGFNGVVDPDAYSSEYNKTYVWEFSNGDKLSAEFASYSKINLKVEYNYAAHLNPAVNLDGYDSVEDKIEDGITYNELKAAIGNVDGLLACRRGYSGERDYLWVSSTAAKYLKASVNEQNIVTFVSGAK